MIQEVNQTIKSNNAPAMAEPTTTPTCCTARANYDRAIPYYNQAIKLQPGNADALN